MKNVIRVENGSIIFGQGGSGESEELIAPITTTSQTWTKNPKYKKFMIRSKISGYWRDTYVPYDAIVTEITMYYNESNHAFVVVNLAESNLSYVFNGVGFSVQEMYLYGVC